MADANLNAAILVAIKSRVATIPIECPVTWGDIDFEPDGEMYLRATYIPNQNIRRALSGDAAHRRLSLLQVDVFSERNEAVEVIFQLAGIVADHFPADQRMVAEGATVRVTKAPDVAQVLPSGAYVMVPVTIQLETLA